MQGMYNTNIFGPMRYWGPNTSQNLCDEFEKIMHDEFEMSMMGELNFFLGLQIKQMEDIIFFNQSKYIKEMVNKFGLEDSKPTKTPMSTEFKITKDDEADSVDSSIYQGMISSLLYLTASRPDIMFSVCLCARFQENPKTTHLEDVKCILMYVRGTTHLGLWYPKGTRIETTVYTVSDYAGDYIDRKSTSKVYTFMGCCLTSWFVKKQTTLVISTTEAEHVSVGKSSQQAIWMKQDLIDYDIRLDDVPIMCDNKCAIELSNTLKFNAVPDSCRLRSTDPPYLVMVPTYQFKYLNIPLFSRCALVRSSLSDSSSENTRKDGASLSSDDEDEEEMTKGVAIFTWDNGLRVYGKDMIVKKGQEHGKRHRAVAFVYDFLHSINDHLSEVELSSNG
nr:hypothetical protein [Tanacetum cinerariifolium]